MKAVGYHPVPLNVTNGSSWNWIASLHREGVSGRTGPTSAAARRPALENASKASVRPDKTSSMLLPNN